MNFTSDDVKRLRDISDEPMMRCKRALVASGGDIDGATEILRVRDGLERAEAKMIADALCSLESIRNVVDITIKDVTDGADKAKITDQLLHVSAELTKHLQKMKP